MTDSMLAAALRSDRGVVAAALLLIAALALGYTAWLATGFDMSGMMSPDYRPWSPGYFTFMVSMWIVMMIGMMTPSVAPTVLLYAAFARQSAASGNVFAPTGWFYAGYLLAWTLFAILATLLQWLLEWAVVVTPMMAGTGRALGGAMLVAAGLYQWLPAKQACLAACRAPLSFVQRHGGFQPEAPRSFTLGFRHGLYCIGCCWALMLLLFAFGVMNLTWIAGLMIYVLLEKVLPWPRVVSRAAGLAAVVAGALLMA